MKRFYDENDLLSSSWIGEAFYDEKDRILYAKMKTTGTIYGYKNVPKNVYVTLVNSYSAGDYFNSSVKALYDNLGESNIYLEKRSNLKWTVTVQGTWDIEVHANTLEEAKAAAENDAPEGVVVKGARVSFE